MHDALCKYKVQISALHFGAGCRTAYASGWMALAISPAWLGAGMGRHIIWKPWTWDELGLGCSSHARCVICKMVPRLETVPSSACGRGAPGPGSAPRGPVQSPGAKQASGMGLHLTTQPCDFVVCPWSPFKLAQGSQPRSSGPHSVPWEKELAGVCPIS